MESEEVNTSAKPEEKMRTPSPEAVQTQSTRRNNRMRSSEIVDPQQMEKFISLLNFKNKDSDQLLKIALKILKYRRHNDLSHLELEALQNATKNMEFFQTMNRSQLNVQLNLHQRCCRAMEYLFLPQGSVLFQKGDPSDKLYIILTGSVNVFAVKTQEQINKEREWMQRMSVKVQRRQSKIGRGDVRRSAIIAASGGTHSVLKSLEDVRVNVQQKEYNVRRARDNLFKPKDVSDSSMSDRSESIAQIQSRSSSEDEHEDEEDDDDDEDDDEDSQGEQGKGSTSKLLKKLFGNIEPNSIQNLNKFFTDGVFHLIYETTLEAGLLFGELGLMKNKSRRRTIICKEDAEFGTISKVDFLEIMNMVKERRRREKIYFVEKTLFPEFIFEINSRYAELMKKQIVIKGQKIYNDKEKPQKMYLIREGEITLYLRKGRTQKEIAKDWDHYQEFFELLRKSSYDSTKLIPVAILSAGQYFGEEDLLSGQIRTLTAICTSHRAKLYTIRLADLRKCFDDFPATRAALQRRLNQKLKQRIDYKRRNVEVSQTKAIEMQSVRTGSHYYAIKQSVKEIFSEANMNFIETRLAEQEEKKAQKNLAKSSAITGKERQEKTPAQSLDPSMANKPDSIPATGRKASVIQPNAAEPIIEYQNKPINTNPEMNYKHFGKHEEDTRKLLLRGIRSDAALLRKKANKDEISKMSEIVESNFKTVEELCKISLPISDLFPMLKEFTTKENEKKQRRKDRVREIEKQREEAGVDHLPKLNSSEVVNIHMQKKRLLRSESVMRGKKDRSIDRSRISNHSMMNSGQRDLNYSQKVFSDFSEIQEVTDLRNQKNSFISGTRMLFPGNSIAESGFSSVETHQDIRYYSTIEMQNERKDLPTKVNFTLNLKSIENQHGDDSVLLSNVQQNDKNMDKPPESSRTVLEYRENQKKKNNSPFVMKYRQRSLHNLHEADKARLQKNSESRYL